MAACAPMSAGMPPPYARARVVAAVAVVAGGRARAHDERRQDLPERVAEQVREHRERGREVALALAEPRVGEPDRRVGEHGLRERDDALAEQHRARARDARRDAPPRGGRGRRAAVAARARAPLKRASEPASVRAQRGAEARDRAEPAARGDVARERGARHEEPRNTAPSAYTPPRSTSKKSAVAAEIGANVYVCIELTALAYAKIASMSQRGA